MYDKSGNIMDRREMLKVKVKSLAEEARIIRKEEKKTGTLRYVWVPEQERRGRPVGPDGEIKRTKAHWRRVRMGVNPLAAEMWAHRVKHVRHETRLTHIAYGLIRGKTYEKMECIRRKEKELKEADWKRIYSICRKYGGKDVDTMLVEKHGWIKPSAVAA